LLQGTSPAIDRGVAQLVAASGEAIPPNPITGFIGAAPDLGWREFGSPVVITPTASPIPSPTFATATMLPTFTPISPTPTVATLTPAPSVTSAPLSPTVALPTSTQPVPATATITSTPQPIIQNLTPNTASASTTVNVTVSGANFVNGAVVSFEGGQGTPPQITTPAQVVNPTTIVITVNTATDTSLGTQVWDVRVTNPNNSTALLPDAFTVTVTP
jgi:hypothetical protein